MATFNNGESGLSVRTKLNTIINKVEGASTIDNDINVDGVNLSAISETIADTAVDIFVYDTRKDSDGGAWRKRTQHTSWYNETLNTATRGSRKEFPAVAVIVKESGQVTIYDGDDPDLPMWMVFNGGRTASVATSHMIPSTAATAGGVSMLNGKLITGNNGDGTGVDGLSVIDFLTEKALWYTRYGSATAYSLVGLQISERNEDFTRVIQTGEDTIVNRYINDVAMTVLPNAPIDAATGLPVPTIAVATDGGVSVIKDDGTVVDTTSTDVFEGVSFVKSQYGADLYAVNTTFADDPQWYPNVGGLSDGFTFTKNFYANTPSYEKLSSDVLSQQSGNVFAPIAEHTFAVGMATSAGIGLDPALNLVQHSTTLDNDGLVAYINSSHNTGWQVGDIKLATLSDTDATNVTGSEEITNGDFSTDSDWTKGTGWSITGGSAVHTGTTFSHIFPSTNIALEAGKTYVAEVVVSAGTGGAYFYWDNTSQYYTMSNTGTFVITFKPTVTTNIHIGTAADGKTIDSISVRLAEEDRSVNGNGLQVFGTVTKSAVATGADLVGYSGFSASNYLQQPYNSDLDFGTGDFCVMGWHKYSTAAIGNQHIFELGPNDGTSNGSRIVLYLPSSTVKYNFYIADSLGGSQFMDSNHVAQNNVWEHVCVLRKGTTGYVYVNGELKVSGTMDKDLSTTNEVLVLGNGFNYTNEISGSLALWRISATAPSPEQILKIYNDEKVLFQEGAQATLYGSSDAVTALAYDDSTNLLHVGTSAGRSVFQGLRRVDNTTTAVGAAISASNGLVADE